MWTVILKYFNARLNKTAATFVKILLCQILRYSVYLIYDIFRLIIIYNEIIAPHIYSSIMCSLHTCSG